MFNWFKSHDKIDCRKVRYSPKEDITAYEVSKCLEIFLYLMTTGKYMTYESNKSFVLGYPTEISRHFKLE